MVRQVRTALLLFAAATIALVPASCRDIDEPPPLPVLDPDAPRDGGTDAPADGGLAGTTKPPTHPIQAFSRIVT